MAEKSINFGFDIVLGKHIIHNVTSIEDLFLGIKDLYTDKFWNNPSHYKSNLNKIITRDLFIYANSYIDNGYKFNRDSIKNFDKYIYPIKLSADLENLTGLHAGLLGSQAVGQPFWKKLSFDVLKDLRNRKALLLLDYTMECFFKPKHHESLQVVLRQAKIPFESVMLLINGVNSAENYHEMFLHNKPLHQKKYYKIRDIAFTLEHSSYHYSYGLEKNVNTCLTIDKFLESKSIIRNDKFLMHCKGPKPHRLDILEFLYQNKYHKEGNYSLLINNSELYTLRAKKGNSQEIRYPNLFKIEKVPINLKQETYQPTDINAWDNSAWDSNAPNVENPQPYLDSYFNICLETNNDFATLTEKIFKPIINFQPFILVTGSGGLKQLKDWGFKTFDGFIDESYDTIKDPIQRKELIQTEIKKLCEMNISDLHEWYWKMEDILIHNHNHLINFKDTDNLPSKKIFEELYEFTK